MGGQFYNSTFHVFCSHGRVLVQLRNVGTDAFKHSDYGDSITVERKISVDGGSSYRLKSVGGEFNLSIFYAANFTHHINMLYMPLSW